MSEKIKHYGVGKRTEHFDEPLFDRAQPAHHKSDPDTSAETAHDVTESGLRGKQCQRVLNALKSFPSVTSAELADIMGVDRVMPARRLPDLEKAGLVEKAGKRWCAVTKRTCVVWSAKQR